MRLLLKFLPFFCKNCIFQKYTGNYSTVDRYAALKSAARPRKVVKNNNRSYSLVFTRKNSRQKIGNFIP